jgi:chromatin assembly factor 1 subunit A
MGRNPFAKDSSLDYDVDSEAEWEEGDNDPGEDIENDAGDDDDEKALDEEGDTRVYNYQDGWLAEDDEISVEDGTEMDDDTKKLLRASRKRAENAFAPVCIVAPAIGGVPIVEAYERHDSSLQDRVDGFPVEEAFKLVSSHHGEVLSETEVVLDAFPPPLLEERDGAESNEPSEEDMKAFARFVHHSELVSKSQVVEELRSSHPAITASRAQAHRILDSIAVKQRHPNGGVYWEVKTDFIKNLGLEGELKVSYSYGLQGHTTYASALLSQLAVVA